MTTVYHNDNTVPTTTNTGAPTMYNRLATKRSSMRDDLHTAIECRNWDRVDRIRSMIRSLDVELKAVCSAAMADGRWWESKPECHQSDDKVVYRNDNTYRDTVQRARMALESTISTQDAWNLVEQITALERAYGHDGDRLDVLNRLAAALDCHQSDTDSEPECNHPDNTCSECGESGMELSVDAYGRWERRVHRRSRGVLGRPTGE